MKRLKVILNHKKQLLMAVILAIVAGFIGLSYFVIITPPSFLDLHISEELQERHSVSLDTFMKIISWLGYVPQSIVMVLFTAALFFVFNYGKEAVFTLCTMASGLLSSGLKLIINRPRPTDDLVRTIEKARHQSFPSGHMLFYTVFFGFLIIAMSNLEKLSSAVRISVIVFSASIIFLVPVSRVYLGAHWFTDVLGGFMLGIICLFGLGYMYLFCFLNKNKDEKTN